MRTKTDVVIVGAGIIGLGHAAAFARRGLSVRVVERNLRAQGASVRNFGMVWTIGQPFGELRTLALESNRLWRETLTDAGLWHNPCGSLHLAHHPLEMQVLAEFHEAGKDHGCDTALLSPAECAARAQGIKTDGLVGGMASSQEVCVDPRLTLGALPAYLSERYGVEFHFGRAATEVAPGRVRVGEDTFEAETVVLCTGDDYETLLPEHFAAAPLSRTKLQMLRAEPDPADWRIGVLLCTGLTIGHYRNFEVCPSLAELKSLHEELWPGQVERGIHILVSQHGTGEITLGDSHEYGRDLTPFAEEETYRLTLEAVGVALPIDRLHITQRWIGVYGTTDGAPLHEAEPLPGVHVRVGVSGAGMTLSMGLGERTAQRLALVGSR